MNAEDEAEFVRTIVGLAALKPGKPLTPEGIELFWHSMQDWDMQEFVAAARHLSKTVEFMPNPYHFEQLRKVATDQTAGDAWAKVLEAVRTMNPRETPQIEPKIDAVVRQLGGYQHLCTMTSEEMPWRMKRFTELWSDYSEAEEAQLALPSAATNRLSGPQRAKPLQLVRK